MSALADKSLNIPGTSALPTYASATEVELAGIAPLTSTASLPPAYDDATATVTMPAGSDDTLGSSDGPPRAPFAPTVHFQIETEGKPWLSLPIGTRPDPIPVYRVEAGSWAPGSTPAYVSLRSSRSSNSCSLVRGDDDGSQMPVCTTLYRFGPGKPPVLRLPRALISPHAGPASPACPPGERAHGDVRTEGDGDLDLLVMPKSLVTRTQVLETPLGTFQWRYASRREVTAAERADDLLVCELDGRDRVQCGGERGPVGDRPGEVDGPEGQHARRGRGNCHRELRVYAEEGGGPAEDAPDDDHGRGRLGRWLRRLVPIEEVAQF
ncbi:hypothetical protein LY78DRAFT_656211 [Colletotrichum sublineola]|nr:hypothetical protein LY78DRAFT_656211 [Colletotrichum sublineola]